MFFLGVKLHLLKVLARINLKSKQDTIIVLVWLMSWEPEKMHIQIFFEVPSWQARLGVVWW